ncbi:hypothetical protein M409DRAFT_20777 [Zasmidium cellare ATCC 36951]|uniref:INSIG domain-containing protein n=1 Tax=Zasmidium cellare ATCC 36951 TaxID=1080233 RepID=A0A6A6CRJ4_ZASCE|nr:uncharacterized protein M409DRAFT_20777 [Zasmidium cellare ATCC 36951]KAF2168760.1 hypothetical protein M409DRAFT_20777 [Zasmidium cellare ATCC 36951]
MSHPIPHDEDSQPILKPRPRRPFELSSAPNSAPPTPPSDAMNFPEKLDKLDTSHTSSRMADSGNGSATPSRTRSFLNLTASTLFGIYQPTGFGTETENPTPWGNGAQTPADSRHGSFDFSRISLPDSAFERDGANGRVRRRSTQPQVQIRKQASYRPRKGFKGYFLPLAGRVVALFGTGVLYGLLISHLHDRQKLAPVAVNLDRSRWSYLATWGFIGVLLGEALPWADMLWHEDGDEEDGQGQPRKVGRDVNAWLDVVRSIGAFVGIAFAIRKLPWQSTLQLSLTLALANPAVWYLIDRSPPGFILSTIVALSGTAVLLGINPTLVPAPSPWAVIQGQVAGQESLNETLQAVKSEDLVLGLFSQESVGVATWIASVLFVSSVCFGNIGRRLAPSRA